MEAEVADGGQVVELEVLAPEDGVGARLAGGARVQHVVQAQLAVVALLGRQLARLDDPQLQHVVHPPAVVLQDDERTEETSVDTYETATRRGEETERMLGSGES